MAINLTDSLNAATTKGKLGDAKQVYLNGDTKNLQQTYEETSTHFDTLDNRSTQIEKAIQDISATGGASTANAVSYNNSTSKLEAVTAQGAIDEVSSIGHFAKRGGIVNISTNYNSINTAEVLTLAQAIDKVPSKDRTLGFVATFLTTNGWVLYQFNGDSLTEWLDTSNWVLSAKFNDLTDLEKQIFQTYSIDGEFVNPQGKVLSDPARPFCRTDYINIKYADRIVIRDGFSNQYCCTVAFYDKNKKFIEGIINPLNKEGKYSGVIESSNFPEGTEYVMATSYTTYRDRSFITVLPTTKVIDLLDPAINYVVGSIPSDFMETAQDIKQYLTESGWINKDGSIYNDASWVYGYITIPAKALSLSLSGYSSSPESAPWIVFLGESNDVLNHVQYQKNHSVKCNIPNGAVKVGLSVRKAYLDKFRFEFRSKYTIITNVEQSITNVEQSITPKYIHGYINPDGELVNYDDTIVEDYCRTDYLWIKNTEYIRIVGAYSNQYLSSYTFYDNNKNVLETHVGAVGEYTRLDDVIITGKKIPKGASYLTVTSRLPYTDKQVFIKKAVSEAVSEIAEAVSENVTQAIAPDTILSSKDIKNALTEVGWVKNDGTIYPDSSWSNGKVKIPSGTKYIKMSKWDAEPNDVVHLIFLDDEDSIVGKISLSTPYVESVIPNRATKVHLSVKNKYKDQFRFGFFYSESPSSIQHDVSSRIGGTIVADLSAVNQSGFLEASGNIGINGSWVHGTIPLSGLKGTILFNNLPAQQYSDNTWNFFVNKEGTIMPEFAFKGDSILGAGVVKIEIPSGAYGLMMTASTEDISTYDIKIIYSSLKETLEEELVVPKHKSLCCPDKYYAVVGKEFNLYYDGVIQGLDSGLLSPFGIYVDVECPDLQNGASMIGVRKDRMWQINGDLLTDSYVGDHNMWISAWDDFGNLIDRKQVTLTVTANPQLSAEKRILCIGDSLTNNGPIVATCGQHFKDLGGTQPIFIGQRVTSGYKHEGYPGYTFRSFIVDAANYAYTIFDVPQGTTVSVDDKYSTNGANFTVMDIRTEGLDNSLRLRCESASGTAVPPSTGVLTKISGQSASDESISYTAVERESGNPFWDSNTGATNFTKYREKMGMGSNKFDVVVIMLGTNDCIGNIRNSMQSSVDAAVTLVNKIFEDAGNYPTKIIVQMTPPDANSVSSWQVYPDSSGNVSGRKIGYWHNLWSLRELLYTEFTKKQWNGKVYLGQAPLGVDRYYGYPYVEKDSSSRIKIKEIFHNNSVHPNTQGYQQLGDGYYLQIKSLL